MNCQERQFSLRSAESLVLDGYRHWTTGLIEQDQNYMEQAVARYKAVVGQLKGLLLYDALMQFTCALGKCARSTLSTCEIGCVSVCRDEALILGLLSGLQHQDETAITLCLDGLISRPRFDEFLKAAEVFAWTLRDVDETLLPIPAPTIKAILIDQTNSNTIH